VDPAVPGRHLGGDVIRFFAPGRAVTQGSKVPIAYQEKGTGRIRATLIEDRRDALKVWRSVVAFAARKAVQEAEFRFHKHEPVVLWLVFLFDKPRTVPKSRSRLTVRPDLDKLERAVKDAMEGIVYVDDGQVDECHKRKRYTRPGEIEGVLVEALAPREEGEWTSPG